MANPEHVEIVRAGWGAIDEWRKKNPGVRLDLTGADLSFMDMTGADLSNANLSNANLHRAVLTNVILADKSGGSADLTNATLTNVVLTSEANSKADAGFLELAATRGLETVRTEPAEFLSDYLERAFAYAHKSNLPEATKYPQFFDSALSNIKALRSLYKTDHDSQPSAELVNAVEAITRELVKYLKTHPDELQHLRPRQFEELIADVTANHGENVLADLKSLQGLYNVDKDTPSPKLITAVKVATDELLAYLKTHPDELYNIRPRQFEELIAEVLASHGWRVELTPATKDGGYDIFAITPVSAGAETSWIIECKKWAKERKVGVDIARSLYAVKGEVRAANCMLATTSDFTRGVHDFKASRYDFDLRNFESVLEWINEYRPHPDGKLYVHENRLILPGEE